MGGLSSVFCIVVGKSCMNSYVVRISGTGHYFCRRERKGDGRLEMKMVSERQEFHKLIICCAACEFLVCRSNK